MIRVVCGIIYQDDKVFICRRKPSKSLGGYWEFPGGKIETGESNEDSLKRELLEELQMEVDVVEYFGSSQYDYENFSIDLIAYTCNLRNWNLCLTDHDQYDWVTPDEILKWKLAPADIPLAQSIKNKKAHNKT
ncbi:(deoxy)nucleoside triphosphate pyrophosphohydrolase [uncultured Aquimarina sp.]|uniref:(deoxy)nucleoside triphosphate pyrophosphohydrolase n=1 Tax=uncultured Aquimarina sp. TaxID=575652 RepID=UPI0026045C90|nr:(deoxy)nucleoside triphosphate pyrophosphohydrolase [uncultured Aquimarina sp.]